MGGTIALKDGLLDMEILAGVGPSGASTASPLLPYLEPCRQLHVTTHLTVTAGQTAAPCRQLHVTTHLTVTAGQTAAAQCTKESYSNVRKARRMKSTNRPEDC